MIVPVILSGGAGTRLWPLSRGQRPKQFLPLLSARTMLQETLGRLEGLEDLGPPVVVCNQDHRFLVAEQLRAFGVAPGAILLEPCGRNTAPAVALAALHVLHACPEDPSPILLVLPADHVVQQADALQEAIRVARSAAQGDQLVTFGVVPTRAEPGFGYIRCGGSGPVRRVEAFVEKPEAEVAEAFVASGGYLWNAGMFLFRASVYLDALERHAPVILEACTRAWKAARKDLDFVRVDEEAFRACPSDSIDYALMERVDEACVVPLDAGWADVGSWSALHEASDQDANGNTLRGDVVAVETQESCVVAESRLVATLGVRDLIVVETKDAVLVVRRDRAQDVKGLAEQLESMGRSEAQRVREVHRPWGSYDSVDSGRRFQVKRLIVKPGGALSTQMHHHRAEHWIVVQGTAEVTCGDRTFRVHENESTYIPMGAVHRLTNPGLIPLHVIEVQSGAYLGEDDIVRFADGYGRVDEE